jgi:catechol 2,3-dioxygenase-like lactoylglutathione lyase family enzyme
MTSRPHINLTVSDLDRAVRFYSAMLGTAPTKTKADYANFRLQEPPIHLALQRGARPVPGTMHFGIELFDDRDLAAWRRRAESAGLLPVDERAVTCCYALADKFWLRDPDGHAWEFWVRKADVDDADADQTYALAGDSTAARGASPGACGDSTICCAVTAGAGALETTLEPPGSATTAAPACCVPAASAASCC